MVGDIPQKFLWRVLVAHLVFFVVFAVALRLARGESDPPRRQQMAIFTAEVPTSASPAGIPR